MREPGKEQMAAYTEAVKSGLYAKKTGLTGKYDNVRRYWEDETTRRLLRPHIYRLIKWCRSKMKRLRVMDLGCGSADGFELLAGIRDREPNLHDVEVALMPPQMLGRYKGVDLNEALLDQARAIYGSSPKLVFEKGDFTKGLPIKDGEKPYDLYFTSFGTCSHHNDDETLIALLAEMAERTVNHCVIVCDWVGRYSYEWQTLWTNDISQNRNIDYVVSYIYEKEEREARRDELQHLTLRLISRQEAERIVGEASKRAGVEIKPLTYFDRSVLTGRHMDTQEYNPSAQPIRLGVNSLHERNMRTDLGTLVIDYVPKPGFDFLNDYFERIQTCWNILVNETQDLMETYDEEKQDFSRELAPIPSTYPAALREMIDRMRRVVAGVGWLGIGLPRENIIEPQLGYALRYLVTNLQQGRGCGHGLVGVFEVSKD
jgi:SAM-dependent methyltransferase